MDFDVVVEIFAKNPPSILIALGGIAVLIGSIEQPNNQSLIANGWLLVEIGVILQILWLFRHPISDLISNMRI
jgi:hypothetical protein